MILRMLRKREQNRCFQGQGICQCSTAQHKQSVEARSTLVYLFERSVLTAATYFTIFGSLFSILSILSTFTVEDWGCLSPSRDL